MWFVPNIFYLVSLVVNGLFNKLKRKVHAYTSFPPCFTFLLCHMHLFRRDFIHLTLLEWCCTFSPSLSSSETCCMRVLHCGCFAEQRKRDSISRTPVGDVNESTQQWGQWRVWNVVESRHSLSDRSKLISSFHLNKWLEDECDIHNHLAETEELNSNAIYYARKLNPQT